MFRRYLYNHPNLKTRRQELRSFATESEKKLWKRLQKNQLGVKFRRQHSVGHYILDFYCPEKNLAIELDGGIHKDRQEMDQYRTRTLAIHKIKVIRFWNEEITGDVESVIHKIRLFLFTPPKLGGEGVV
ncbi:MAG: endonuclease domain-containing protein [Patescibacteria group bacterium]